MYGPVHVIVPFMNLFNAVQWKCNFMMPSLLSSKVHSFFQLTE